MRLADLIAAYPTVRLAAQEDNARILEFFERTPMQTEAFDVQYRRRPDFFKLLRYQGDRVFVFISENEAGEVRGVGSISLRPGWVGGKPVTIGYLGDLRVSMDRALARIWRRIFSELLSNAHLIEEIADCSHWYTAVIDGNRGYLNNFNTGRPRPDRLSLVPIAPFTMRNLIMRLPLAGRFGGRRWKVRGTEARDEDALLSFFEEENRRAPLGFRGEMARRMSVWDGLTLDRFVHASDAQGMVACVAPWSPGQVKQTVVSRLPASLKLIGMAARALPKAPLRMPTAGEQLRVPYLTHLTFAARLTPGERAEVFLSLLHHLFDGWRGADWHCVSFCDFGSWNLGRALGGFIQQTVPITLYAVAPPGAARSAEALRGACPPGFEMAMV